MDGNSQRINHLGLHTNIGCVELSVGATLSARILDQRARGSFWVHRQQAAKVERKDYLREGTREDRELLVSALVGTAAGIAVVTLDSRWTLQQKALSFEVLRERHSR